MGLLVFLQIRLLIHILLKYQQDVNTSWNLLIADIKYLQIFR
jgi:hypothetical protein